MELIERARELDWYHTLELAPGHETPGMFDLRPVVDRYELPERMDGMRALDVGTWDGFWAFEMERRGAQVTALDLDDERDLDWPVDRRPTEPPDTPRGAGFRLAKEALNSNVERIDQSIYTASPQELGMFDLVFCGSVLIHLRDPMLALERMAALCGGTLILAEEYSRRLGPFRFVRAAEFRGDSPWSTWWIPAVSTWMRMVRTAGFEDVREHGRFKLRFRTQRGGVPHVVLHARGGDA
jgi:tRNA (mo5U34)-methyltransferase